MCTIFQVWLDKQTEIEVVIQWKIWAMSNSGWFNESNQSVWFICESVCLRVSSQVELTDTMMKPQWFLSSPERKNNSE